MSDAKIPLPLLTPPVSLQRLAEGYANVAQGFHQRLPKLERQIDELTGAMLRIEGQVQRMYERMGGSSPPTSMFPNSRGFNVTATGSVRLDEVQGAIDRLEKERDLAEARAQGARELTEARRKNMSFMMPLVVGFAGLLGWVLTHIFHL